MLKLAVVGGNISASALISLLRGDANGKLKLIGIYEKKQDAPGVILARKWNIPVFDDTGSLCASNPEIVINVAGDVGLSQEIRAISQNKIEVVEGAGARLLWEIIEKQKRARLEAFKTIENQKGISEFLLKSGGTEGPGDFFVSALEKAVDLLEAPAGSLTVRENGNMKLLVSKGLSRKFFEGESWKIRPAGLTDLVLKNKEIVCVHDTEATDYTRENPFVMSEKIRALLACPVLLREEVVGVLYIDDFKPRQFSERQKASLNLLAGVIALCIDRFRLISKMDRERGELEDLKCNLEKKVTERTEELEKINHELDYANQLKGRFISNMSHELRTPLNSIIGFSDVLADKTFGELTVQQERYLKNIQTSGKHLLELINNVLDIAKIEAGKFEMRYETFSVDDIINEVIDIMKALADNKFVEIAVSVSEDTGAITADRIKLKQILYNLLSNAVKFTPEGGLIDVSVCREPCPLVRDPERLSDAECVRFSVRDTGIGIAPEDREKIFDEFEQSSTSLSLRYGGAGLGLALTRKLVELHGGSITVESNLGEGSTFTFRIPSASSPSEPPKEESIEPANFLFPWMREEAPLILVVEDDLSTVELLTLHLTQAGYKVSHAFNGEEAFEKAKDLHPFAITLDILLPKKDGWEVLQQLKSDQGTMDIPVIIHSIVDNRDLAFALGATDYLLKPLEKEVLLSKLEEITVSKGKKVLPLSVLIIEPEDEVTNSLKEIFEPQGFLIYTAPSGQRGVELAAALRPVVILLDFTLPDMIGFDVITQIKENPSTKDIPIFMLTERDISVEDRMTLVGKIERIVQKHAFDTTELIGHIKELEMLYPKRAGLIDELTGAFSHRYFQIRLAQEVERATRYKLPLNLLLIDLDSFDEHAKQYGEASSRLTLRKIAELLRKNVRGSDVVIRYSGDSFAIILPNTVVTAALSMGNRFNAIIKNYPFVYEGSQPTGHITASIGLTFLDGQSTEEFMLCAKEALSRAIGKGGDRVEVYSREEDERKAIG